MNQNDYQGGYQGGMPSAPAEPRAPRQKKEKINSVELTGYVESRFRDQEIKFVPFQNGGGAININIKTTETTEGPNPVVKTTYIPVNVVTNKNIDAAQLRSIAVGTKVHIVGRLNNRKYEDRSGNKHNVLEVSAYVFEILAPPMQTSPVQYAQQGPQYPPQYGQQGPQYQQPQYPPQYGAQMPQQGPQYPSQQQPQYPPQYAPQYGPQYPQQGQPANQPPQYASQGPQYPQQGQRQPQQQYNPHDLPIGDVNI